MLRASQIHTVPAVERALEDTLEQLRGIHAREPGNLIAQASAEYRIGSLRRRKRALETA